MKKYLLLLLVLLVLLAAGSFGQWLLNDAGYVLVSRGHWRLETTLGFILLLLVCLWLVSLLALTLLLWTWRRLAPGYLSQRMTGYLTRKRLTRGIKLLGQGRWQRAEKLFAATTSADWPLPGQLAAAFAAHQQGKPDDREAYLKAAGDDAAGEQFAQWLALYWRAQDGDEVAQEVEELLAHQPDNLPLRELAAQLAESEQRWDDLQKHMAKLTLTSDERQQALWHGLLKRAATAGTAEEQRLAALKKVWKQMPARLHDEPRLLLQYAGYLAQLGAADKALKLLSTAINKGWDERYASLLDDLPLERPTDLLAQLEGWLEIYQEEPSLALVAGRCALKASLWGKAEAFFRTAAKLGSSVAWAELARLKQAQGDDEAVQACLQQQGQQLSAGLPLLPLPNKSI